VRSKPFIAVAAMLAALLVLAGAMVAYDRSHEDRIAEGVRIGGVHVGGLTSAQAREKLRAEIVAGLQRPVVVDHGDRQWRLTPREARIATNLDATVDEALERSREGGIFARTYRGVTGGEVVAHIEPEVTYSKAAIVRMLDRIRRRVDRKPVDAKVDIGPSGVSRVPSKDGLAVEAAALHREIRTALVRPDGPRRFTAQTHRVDPKVSTTDLEDRYGTVLIVSRKSFKLTLYKRLKAVKTYNIAVGKVGMDTPAGLYNIQNKAENPTWHVPDSEWAGKLRGKVIPPGPENPIKARWMGIYDGAGIHGTDAEHSIGSAASHGCIRMRVAEVKELYERVPVGAPVYIA
jgi:lipoprotein-anchoring transpeptidase ErfK/SrfK